MSTQIDLGPVLSIPKGDWDANTTYERLNLVRHNSAAWICNVDTSTGVEPSEDSEDWFLQVKDTSSVSSVNGMRGDVEITTIQTPSNDSDDTSIANTEWVRDRINETTNSAQSYTDSAISTATTSILNTAAQDASNKATIAVNQALTASETKFATKTAVSGLADNVNTLIKNDVAQDESIANKLDKTGGTMTGSIYSDKLALSGTNTAEYLSIMANTGASATLNLFGRDRRDTYAGATELVADNGSQRSALVLYPNGRADIDGNIIFTSAGGLISGNISFSQNETFLHMDSIAKSLILRGGTEWNDGAQLVLHGKDKDGATALLCAHNGTEQTRLIVYPSGAVTINDYPILTSAGGTITGVLNTKDIIGPDDTGVKCIRSSGYESSGINLFGPSYSGYSGMVELVAQNYNQKALFAFAPDGSASLNGHSIHTSYGGLLLNSSNVQVFYCRTGGGWTAPAGGTWAYLICGEYNAQNIYGVVAGGTYVAWPNSGHPAQGIAFRISN